MRFEIYRDASGQWRFRLKAGNGETIAQSEAYTKQDDCADTIRAIKNTVGPDTEVRVLA